jgi:hypothetical protein
VNSECLRSGRTCSVVLCKPHVWFSSTPLASSPLPGHFAGIISVDLRSGSRWRFDVWLLWRGGNQSSAAQAGNTEAWPRIAVASRAGMCRPFPSLPQTPTGGGEAAVRRFKPRAGWWLSSRLREPMASLCIAGLAQSPRLSVVACGGVERRAALCEDPKHSALLRNRVSERGTGTAGMQRCAS